MDKRLSSPFSQARYAVEIITDRIKSWRVEGSGESSGGQEEGYRLLSWRNSTNEQRQSGGRGGDIVLENEDDIIMNVNDSPPPPYDIDVDISTITDQPHPQHLYLPHHSNRRFHLDPILLLIILLSIGFAIVLFMIFPFPTTIPAFLSILISLSGWTILTWSKILHAFVFQSREKSTNFFNRYSNTKRTIIVATTLFLLYLACLGVCAPEEDLPRLVNKGSEKYFIAANLHDSEDILPKWSEELVKLIDHLGHENVFVSIYESNSHDSTKMLLSSLNQTLFEMDVGRRIVTAQDDRHSWPYNTSPERIGYLANARNKALEPIQSPSSDVRLSDHQAFTKLIFLNDVFYTWKSIVRLLDTHIDGKDEYDQVCAMDFGTSGLYDTWASRDICGTPLRPFWPYVKDEITIDKVRNEESFEVSSCWNGAVVFKAGPFLYQPSKETKEKLKDEASEPINEDVDTEGDRRFFKRGWKMVDDTTYPNSVFSPSLTLPIQFRTSNISACDHSECFLIGYDLHRLYDTVDRPPRIYMNPTVMLAYEKNWYFWHNTVLRIPVIKWWLENWSRGYPFMFVDWIWENAGRRRDYCTWSALSAHLPDRCPPLPGAENKNWDQ
ncbi:uncharacterized protein IL334_000826 [Kwoniella shivajii]|uniref:Capsular associated protein n=1 Tax=Kwoniella shivajii TaxID=564305 RepID=A0ABZ1CQK8_9TREE|nr:hypothetical protein IL334_000826 [Kwoniella shivajii]